MCDFEVKRGASINN